MPTQAWFRNPYNYIKELVECRAVDIAWDKGCLVKRSIDPRKHADLYVPANLEYRLLIVDPNGTAELTRTTTERSPAAVYPTWAFGEPWEVLVDMCANHVGIDYDACHDTSVERAYRPMFGQEHRVVVTDLPGLNDGHGRRLVRQLADLQDQFPHAILHLHGSYSYRYAFGMGFGAADVEPRTLAQGGEVFLPNGKKMSPAKLNAVPAWVDMFDMKIVDLEIPRNRCLYNIRSAVWAAAHWDENFAFRQRRTGDIDSPSTVVKYDGPNQYKDAVEDDMLTCDTCSLQNTCKYYRAESVCSVPSSETSELAKLFRTRDSSRIIEGLGRILGTQAERVEQGLANEQMDGELDPEVTKIINSIMTHGVKMAKLVDPALAGAGATRVGVFVNGAAAVTAGTPNQMIGAIVAELEAQGIAKEDITPEMVERLMAGSTTPALEATATEV